MRNQFLCKALLLIVTVFAVPFVVRAAVPGPTASSGKKSVSGMALVTRSLAAMRGTNLTALDSQAAGTITAGGKSFHVLYKTHGATQLRTELDKPAGKSVLILNGGQAQVTQPDGATRNRLHNNTYGQRIEHIPALSLLSEQDNAEVEVEDPAEDDLNGAKVDTVALSCAPAGISAKDTQGYRMISRTKFFFDKASGYVLAIEYLDFAENDPGSSAVMRTVYSDYRNVNGMAVPFQQTTFMDGQLTSSL